MRKYIMVVVVAACLALCAAVWPRYEEAEEIPKPTQITSVNTPEVPAVAPKEETEVSPQTEKENPEPPQPELSPETAPEPEATPTATPVVPEVKVQPTPEPNPTVEPTPEPTPAQMAIAPSPVTWSMYPDSAGWRARAKARSFMMR